MKKRKHTEIREANEEKDTYLCEIEKVSLELQDIAEICLLYSIFWGFLGVWWIKDMYPRMAKWILKLPNNWGKGLTWCFTIFFIFNSIVSLAAVGRWSERVEGLTPSNAVEEFLDERFHDERMERIYANMEW